MLERKPLYEDILQTLKEHISDKVYKEPESFIKYLSGILSCDKKLTERIADGLSEMDKTAEIQRDKKGNIIYDKETRDTEIVKYTEDIELRHRTCCNRGYSCCLPLSCQRYCGFDCGVKR